MNSVLYQRGLYPADSFSRVKQYGLTLLVTHDLKLKAFLDPLLKQVECESSFVILPAYQVLHYNRKTD